ncbi:DUF6095 family protein [Aquimarina sp. ERC-38]|uniref:DUF6095 family protein n=1 Tax=Aquimarina sp. ERC-38 TaxID=2949996 RepID=UPI00224780EC|nr:DUF6095 family protein [Aquimarina sp. ERC-38]UZO80529.1 DUF6095 family protein [Aquimarina sp. ERC-38]
MEKHTDKELLGKGVQRMAIALILMFAGPVVIHSAFNNKDHFLYYIVLGVGVILAILAIYMGFKGIRTIMDAIFGKRKS